MDMQIRLSPNTYYMTPADGVAYFTITLWDAESETHIANKECGWACFDRTGVYRSGSFVTTDANGFSDLVVVPCPVSNTDPNWSGSKPQIFYVYAWPDPYPVPPSKYGREQRPGIPEDSSVLAVYLPTSVYLPG